MMKLPPLHNAESEENSGEVNLDYFRGKYLLRRTIAHPRNRVSLSRAIAFLNSASLIDDLQEDSLNSSNIHKFDSC